MNCPRCGQETPVASRTSGLRSQDTVTLVGAVAANRHGASWPSVLPPGVRTRLQTNAAENSIHGELGKPQGVQYLHRFWSGSRS